MSTASLQIPIDSLRRLPSGAQYSAKSGQANAVVTVKNDTIIVYAICDSLRRRSDYFESQTNHYREAYENLSKEYEEIVEQSSNPPYPLKKVLIAFLIGVIIGFIIRMLKIKLL